MDAASLKSFRRTILDGAALYRGETRGVAEMVEHDMIHDARNECSMIGGASAHEKRETEHEFLRRRGLAYGTINRIADGQPFIIYDKRSNDLQHRGCNLSRLVDDDCAKRYGNVRALYISYIRVLHTQDV